MEGLFSPAIGKRCATTDDLWTAKQFPSGSRPSTQVEVDLAGAPYFASLSGAAADPSMWTSALNNESMNPQL